MKRGICGILLCAGAATRFGSNKLLAKAGPRATEAIVALSSQHLREALDDVLAVVRPGEAAVRALLEAHGCEVLETERALVGIGASLAAAIAKRSEAEGWIVALGDMPFVRPATIRLVREALLKGALLAAPVDQQTFQRGHPVGFAGSLLDELLALDGDHGARGVIARHRGELMPIPTDDPGILIDIDSPADFAGLEGVA